MGRNSNEQKVSYIIGENGEPELIPRGTEYEYPQTAACFIQSVEDTMEGIMGLATNEAMLFKYGSGTGTDLSPLRSFREKLSGGGTPSGPLAYLKFMSRVAGIVRSGGKTRRAAKMDSLKVTHPDIREFIECKIIEKRKAQALIAQGYSPDEAIETVAYQNANLSVRVTDEFMRTALAGETFKTVPVHSHELADEMPEYSAMGLLELIAKGTSECGDPGIQFHDIINAWHTCPNSGPINASNPCSEYMSIDDSSCNLGSLNLLLFYDGNRFDVTGFRQTSRFLTIAQDAVIDNSSYPTAAIARNSHRFRSLGQGSANLGALIMRLGFPYDSEEGRAVAAAITALQTATVYETSAEMAKEFGPFKEFKKNQEPMLAVIEKHRQALEGINRNKLPRGLENILDEAVASWDRVIEKGTQDGFRNSQATVIAPTGTIGLTMGCDTTGIEPDLALVKKKRLYDGGTIDIVNESVGPALEKLGYSESQISRIIKYIGENETIEGAPIKDEHLPVFDCAINLSDGKSTRYISAEGHLNMMAAVQPFVSGAISKTVNMPRDSSVEDIKKVYIGAWEKGLKSVSIYRDGSHVLQPLSAGSGKSLETAVESGLRTIRRKLPIERDGKIHKFSLSGHEGYLAVGLYEDGTPGETFMTMSKEGSTIGGLMDTIATQLSMMLQYGVPLKDIVRKFRGQKFAPNGFVNEGIEGINTATSVIDYIGQYLERRFLKEEVEPNGKSGEADILVDTGFFKGEEITEDTDENHFEEHEGGICPICENMMVKEGGCNERCHSCNHLSQNGCSG